MSYRLSPSRLVSWADEECKSPQILQRSIHDLSRIIFISGKEFRKNELSLRAAALTFTILLSLVPLLAMSTAAIKGLGGGDQLKKVVYGYMQTIDPQASQHIQTTEGSTPPKEMSEEVSSTLTQHLYVVVDKIFDYVDRTNFARLGTIGVAGMVLSVILVLGNIEMAMNSIWKVKSGRSLMRKIADYLALVVLMPISLNIALASSTVLKSDALLSKFTILLPMVWIQALILQFIPVFFLTLTLYVIYLFFPNTKVKTVPALAGALFAGFFWFEAQNLYISLQVGVSNYNAIYGSFATLPLFLVWLYFGWVFILLGAQIAFAFQNKDNYRLVATDSQPSLRLSAAYDILNYVQGCFEDEKKASTSDFINKYKMYSKNLSEETIDLLIEHGLIHHSNDNSTLMPSLPQGKLSHPKIIQAILGSSFTQTYGGETSSRLLRSAPAPATIPAKIPERMGDKE